MEKNPIKKKRINYINARFVTEIIYLQNNRPMIIIINIQMIKIALLSANYQFMEIITCRGNNKLSKFDIYRLYNLLSRN